MLIYKTNEWKGNGKSYYWNEYTQDGDTINKYKCNEHKHFDGHENEWMENKELQESWKKDDPNMPDWLNNYIK